MSNGTVVAITLLVVASTMVITAGAVTTGGQSQVAQQAEPDGLSGETNLSDADTVFHGEDVNDTAGRSVASAGDVNGDGVDDLIIGAPHNDTGGEDAGAAYVVYGPVDTDEVELEDADVKLVGASADDMAGWSVSHAGDVNDDGYDDVVVGAPNHDSTGSNTGAAYVVYGGDSLPANMSLADANATLQGTDADARAGWSVSNATDADGDDAVLVGAPYANDGAGAAYLVPGADADGTATLDDAAAATMEGESAGHLAGWSVSGAGDVDDDGTADVVVGAMNWSGETNETTSAGGAYVVSTDVSGTVDLGSADLILTGASDRDRAGWSVSSAGDVNDDGVADVVVGAPYHDADAVDATGAAYVVYGGTDAEGVRSLADADRTLTGDREGDLAGWSVSDAGPADVTCDGIDDLLVGAPGHDENGNDSGAAYVVAGAQSPPAFQSLGEASSTFYGEAADDRAGHAVSGAGNVTDDGGPAVLVGAPDNDNDGETDAGAAYLLDSDCGDVTTENETEKPTDNETEKPTDTDTETKTDTETETDTDTETRTEKPTDAPLTETETKTDTDTPDTDTPDTDTPDTDTPDTDTPDTDTPDTDTPDTDTPDTDTPDTDTPDTDTPDTDTPDTDTPDTDTPDTDTPDTDTPDTDTPDTDTPDTDTPDTDTPDTDTPDTETETEDQRAAISFVLLCTTDEGAPTVGGAGSGDCPEGEPFVRWEWTGSSFTVEDGDAGTTMEPSLFKEPNEPVEAQWTSTTYDVTGAVVGAGGETCTFPGDPGDLPDTGDVESCEGTGAASMSNPAGSGIVPGSAPGGLIAGTFAFAGASVLAIRRRNY
ncbi:integrin alpha [Halobacteria archaeon HArc-gm2]|nr:integrin alpha [Halobacteria archaeon HArc-gm2]